MLHGMNWRGSKHNKYPGTSSYFSMGFQLLKRGLLLGRMAVNTTDSIARLEARKWHMHIVDLNVLCVNCV